MRKLFAILSLLAAASYAADFERSNWRTQLYLQGEPAFLNFKTEKNKTLLDDGLDKDVLTVPLSLGLLWSPLITPLWKADIPFTFWLGAEVNSFQFGTIEDNPKYTIPDESKDGKTRKGEQTDRELWFLTYAPSVLAGFSFNLIGDLDLRVLGGFGFHFFSFYDDYSGHTDQHTEMAQTGFVSGALEYRITEIFTNDVDAFYVADGHHRTAAAARVGAEKRAQNPAHTGKEEYNYFMAVCFPQSQLAIIDYNRVVKDLNGLSTDAFFKALGEDFTVERKSEKEIYKPAGLHNFSMYIEGAWYSLTAKPGRYDDSDPIGVLDVTILSNLVLDKILGIKDLRTSDRIDFVGGIRGLGELSRRVDSGEMKVAFALYPVSLQQLINIADTGNIMPPKTTWFEPKLRSGLAIHTLD